jgi:dihydrofolate reductase
MKKSIVVAIAENNAIGKNNGLLCHLPADMKFFRELTTGHSIIMGRKTFESLPNGALPNRRNIVISRKPPHSSKGELVEWVSSLEAAYELCKNEEEVFVIGGAQIYNISLETADNLYITWIHHDFEDADTFFPTINFNKWQEISRIDKKADEKNKYDYSFVKYEKKI